MNDDSDDTRTRLFRSRQYYAAFKAAKREITTRPIRTNRKDLFTVTITAATHNGGTMDNPIKNEQQFIIDLIFKPIEPGFRIGPEEAQLLLAHLGEILRELEEEESAAN